VVGNELSKTVTLGHLLISILFFSLYPKHYPIEHLRHQEQSHQFPNTKKKYQRLVCFGRVCFSELIEGATLDCCNSLRHSV